MISKAKIKVDRNKFEKLCEIVVSRKQSELGTVLDEINELASRYGWDLGKAISDARNRVPAEFGGRKGRR